MDKKEIKKRLKELLKDKRYVHSLGVASVSRHLAETYGYADPDKALCKKSSSGGNAAAGR